MSLFFSWRSAFQKSDLPPTTKLVLFCISTYMNDHGEGAFPSIETLMKDSSLSNRAVITHIKKAQQDGFLEVSQHGFSGQAWRRNEYCISIPKVVNEVHNVDEKVVNLTTEGGEPNDIKVVNEVHTITPVNSPINSPVGNAQDAKPTKKGITIENFFKTDRRLPDKYREFAISEGEPDPERAWDRFFDYWTGRSGQIARKRNWYSTWCNWIRDNVDRRKNNRSYRGGQKQAAGDVTTDAARLAISGYGIE